MSFLFVLVYSVMCLSSPAHPYFMRNCSSMTYHSFWLRMDVVCLTIDLVRRMMVRVVKQNPTIVVGILPVGLSQRPLLDLLAAVERNLLGVGYHAGVHVP